ncbi:acyltransferase family protein [Sulfurospirillum barnesii]|uniref:Putative acyltransferase n=1 Tax=Sulfurospirillum barnesii (strain ATCC 700032 / DSM 10660 / SES-3) TaxID=760154 RepID=I3XW47_SULBS|nr:acyltransferase [Sulfurospirillum barnesii]AFL68171.1 putative acyltransferase [Sulfurospirillum barnesii SES-3]
MLEKFDISITNASKGMALMLILWHHLFYEKPESGWLVFQTALLAKVCVGIYVVLSGYGLAESIKKRGMELGVFYKRRLLKLYMNYWLIALLFVPFGAWFMGRTLLSVYGEHSFEGFMIQMLGFHMFTWVSYGYNATWWFMSLIIVLYAIFPLVNFLSARFGWWFLAFCAALLFVPIPLVNDWIFPFAVGVFLSQRNGLVILFEWFQKRGVVGFFILLVATLFMAWYRQHGWLFDSVRADTFFGILLIIWTTKFSLFFSWGKKALEFIGVHSFNIFLFHTFIYYYYFPDFIYGFYSPLLIFLVLLGVCLLISMVIERFKLLIGFDKLI